MTKGALLLRGEWRVSDSCRDDESLATVSNLAPIKVSAGTDDYRFSLQLKCLASLSAALYQIS
jgi:hypothetical protein